MSARDHNSTLQPNAPSTALILLHGLCSTPDELSTVKVALERHGYMVHSEPIVGYSFDVNAPLQTAAPWEQWIDAVEHRVDALRMQHDKVMFVGISAGATLALCAAMRCGARVDALVLMSTTLVFDGWAVPITQSLLALALYTPLGRFWRYQEREPYGVKNERVRAWIARELRTRQISRAGSAVIDIGHLREHDRLLRHVRPRLADVQCTNVLAVHAREDEIASVRNLQLLASGLRCGTFRSVVLGNSYHMITIDNDRQQVLREILTFTETVTHGDLPAQSLMTSTSILSV